jgi:DNA-binding transcriptional LysR family regulator
VHPTTVSRRISAAEDSLGQRFVIRRGRLGCTLTPVARQLASTLLPLMEAMDHLSQQASRSQAAPVRIAVTPNGARLLAARLPLEALSDEGTTVELIVGNRAVDLARGEADLALRVLPVDEPSLVRTRVGAVRYGLFASDRYLASRPVRCIDDGLAGHRVLAPSLELAAGPEGRWLATFASGATVVLRAADHPALAEAAAQGAGLAVLPAGLAGFHPLRCAWRLESIPARDVWLVYHQDLRKDRRVQRVAAAIREVMEQHHRDEEHSLARLPAAGR